MSELAYITPEERGFIFLLKLLYQRKRDGKILQIRLNKQKELSMLQIPNAFYMSNENGSRNIWLLETYCDGCGSVIEFNIDFYGVYNCRDIAVTRHFEIGYHRLCTDCINHLRIDAKRDMLEKKFTYATELRIHFKDGRDTYYSLVYFSESPRTLNITQMKKDNSFLRMFYMLDLDEITGITYRDARGIICERRLEEI